MKTRRYTQWFVPALVLLTVVVPQLAMARDAPWVGQTLDGQSCSDFAAQGFGPYDYTNPRHRANHLNIVEGRHFTDKVRSLRGGETLENPLGDIDYTIRAFPNHHPALYAMIRYATEEAYSREAQQAWRKRYGRSESGRELSPPECMLQRAIAFAPEDYRVRILAGLFYHRKARHEQASKYYEQAISLDPESAEAHYNYGLLLLDMKRYTDAREHARKAYSLGYPLNGLRRKLAAVGHAIDR